MVSLVLPTNLQKKWWSGQDSNLLTHMDRFYRPTVLTHSPTAPKLRMWSGLRESNPRSQLGRLRPDHSAKAAKSERISTVPGLFKNARRFGRFHLARKQSSTLSFKEKTELPYCLQLAEGTGFEPVQRFRSSAFQAAPIGQLWQPSGDTKIGSRLPTRTASPGL